MSKFFEIFGKVMLVLLVLGAMSYGGYYFGIKTKQITKPEAVNTEVEVTETIEPIIVPTQQALITVVGGLPKSAGLSFDQYSVMTGTDWTSKKESQTAMDEKLILTKDGVYTISIFQAATGGALCLYPGDPEFEGPSSKYAVFTNLTTKDGRTLRRSGDVNGTAFTICQKAADNSYQQPTIYGHISIKTPDTWTQEDLTEIDSILSSLKKI
jgi:hypothetical protein